MRSRYAMSIDDEKDAIERKAYIPGDVHVNSNVSESSAGQRVEGDSSLSPFLSHTRSLKVDVLEERKPMKEDQHAV